MKSVIDAELLLKTLSDRAAITLKNAGEADGDEADRWAARHAQIKEIIALVENLKREVSK